mmetsp:Transcript_8999/g.32870  ORF Transcript_8999/g.32870 Transcript_8999/m.32870 type:complete len:230 (+) Transcript_8999:3696-4385(+)
MFSAHHLIRAELEHGVNIVVDFAVSIVKSKIRRQSVASQLSNVAMIIAIFPFITNLLNFIRHALDAESLLVSLFKIEGTVVQRFVIVLLIHVNPNRGHLFLNFSPFQILLLQTTQHHRDSDHGIVKNHSTNVLSVVGADAVDTLNGTKVNWRQEPLWYAVVGRFLSSHAINFFKDGLKCIHSHFRSFQDHVKFESIILASEKCLFILVFTHGLETVVLRTRCDTDPIII